MLTRLVRIQLVIFTIASLVGVSTMAVKYLQVPTLLGLGRIQVTLELPTTGGLYRFANVTYRGVQIGKVTDVRTRSGGAIATLSLATSPSVPEDLVAEVRSVSAVGEQYVDLRPHRQSAPYLRDGSVIPAERTVLPQPVAPMMDRVSALIAAVPKDKLHGLLDESFTAVQGMGPQLQTLTDTTTRIAADANSVADRTARLIEDAEPVLAAQADSADALRTWSAHLAAVGRQLVANDPQTRTVLAGGPGAAREASQLLDDVKLTLPVLLANLTTLGEILVTYRPALEQLLVLLPPLSGFYLSATSPNNATGIPIGDFRISAADPNPCTTGFLPPSSWRSPADTSELDTPEGLYCKLPQDSPIAVRGARNYPCLRVPGKYAPTVHQCNSDRPFEPLAMRQHALGPYPIDPNLIAQGIPPDSRIDGDANLFGPIDGTALPPGIAVPPHAAPTGPSVAIAHYDPSSGRYATPDGRVGTQSDVVAPGPAASWKDLVLPESG